MIDDKVYDTYLCISKDFKQKGESKVALDAFYQAERNFDHGLSLLFQCMTKEDYAKIDVMEDKIFSTLQTAMLSLALSIHIFMVVWVRIL